LFSISIHLFVYRFTLTLSKQRFSHLSACDAQADAVFDLPARGVQAGVVVDDEVEFFFGGTVVFGKAFVNMESF